LAVCEGGFLNLSVDASFGRRVKCHIHRFSDEFIFISGYLYMISCVTNTKRYRDFFCRKLFCAGRRFCKTKLSVLVEGPLHVCWIVVTRHESLP